MIVSVVSRDGRAFRWAVAFRVPAFLDFSFAFRVPALLYDIVSAFPLHSRVPVSRSKASAVHP